MRLVHHTGVNYSSQVCCSPDKLVLAHLRPRPPHQLHELQSAAVSFQATILDWVVTAILLLSSIFLSSSIFFFRHLPSQLTERNSTKTGHMLGPKCDLKMHVWNVGYTVPLQVGGPKPPFSTTSRPKGKFNGVYLRKETPYIAYIIGQVRWKLQELSYIVLKCHDLWFTNGLKLNRHFTHPP